jgi:hypothetical protein
MNKVFYKRFILIILILGLTGCQFEVELDEFNCENSTYTSCKNNTIECEGERNISSWHFQQTWFTKPERNQEFFGAVFGNETGQFWYPGEERDGSYCIDDKTILFKNDKSGKEIEKIEIIQISETEMVLEFKNGNRVTYYNPESSREITPEMLELLKKAKPVKEKN